LLSLGLAVATLLGPDAVRAQEGSPVSSIVIRADTLLEDVEQLVDFLAVEVGEPYSLDAVSGSIRNLQASGRTGQIEAFARSTPEGVEVTFALWATFRVVSVELAGDLGIKRRDLMAEVEVRPRSPLIESQILRDFYRLGDRLAVEGFIAARVTPEVDIDEERKLANVTYRIDSGPHFTVAGIASALLSRQAVLQSQTRRRRRAARRLAHRSGVPAGDRHGG
jgi:outer membrane protein assembly factor BamA